MHFIIYALSFAQYRQCSMVVVCNAQEKSLIQIFRGGIFTIEKSVHVAEKKSGTHNHTLSF